jgi:hypothetical protein
VNELSEVLVREIITSADPDGRSVLDMSAWTVRIRYLAVTMLVYLYSCPQSRTTLEAAGKTILGNSFDPLNSPVTNAYTRAVRELMCVVV